MSSHDGNDSQRVRIYFLNLYRIEFIFWIALVGKTYYQIEQRIFKSLHRHIHA
jgi:hypothetical protein